MRLGVLCLSTALALAAAEGLLRLLTPPPAQMVHGGFLFYSRNPFRIDENGALHYSPGDPLRIVAAFNDHVEYDVRVPVNGQGFIDHEDYDVRKSPEDANQTYAFVGNSFTAGFHGGKPWVPALRDNLRSSRPGLQIYNLGVSGTGPGQWRILLESIARKGHAFDHIVILGISEDFNRVYWKPAMMSPHIWMQFDGMTPEETFKTRFLATLIPAELSADGLQKFIPIVRRQRQELTPVDTLTQQLVRRSYLLNRLYFGLKKLHHPVQDANIEELGRIAQAFPDANVHFFHLPQRLEVAQGAYVLRLKDKVEDAGLTCHPVLEEENWDKGMFLERDPHPNARGYRNISACVARRLGMEASAPVANR